MPAELGHHLSVEDFAETLRDCTAHMRMALLIELLAEVEKQFEDSVECRTFLRRMQDRIAFRLREGTWLV